MLFNPNSPQNILQLQLGFKHIFCKLCIYVILHTLPVSGYVDCRTIQRFLPNINISMVVPWDEPRDLMQHCSLLCWAATPPATTRPEAASNNPGHLPVCPVLFYDPRHVLGPKSDSQFSGFSGFTSWMSTTPKQLIFHLN